MKYLLITLMLISSTPASAQVREVSEEIAAPREVVWQALTTSQGVTKWQVALADLKLEPGAIWRTSYKPDGMLGDQSTIENRLLTYDPERMYSLRIEKPPTGFPFMKSYGEMWTVVYLEQSSPTSTRVVIRSLGFSDNEESRKMSDFFEKGNRYTLEKLKQYLEQKQ